MGLTIFIAIIVYNVRVIRSLMRQDNDPEAAQLGRILLIQHLAVLVNSMFVPISYQTVLWFTLAFPSMARYAYVRSAARAAGGPPVAGGPAPAG